MKIMLEVLSDPSRLGTRKIRLFLLLRWHTYTICKQNYHHITSNKQWHVMYNLIEWGIYFCLKMIQYFDNKNLLDIYMDLN